LYLVRWCRSRKFSPQTWQRRQRRWSASSASGFNADEEDDGAEDEDGRRPDADGEEVELEPALKIGETMP
jgi:hypothetical protein